MNTSETTWKRQQDSDWADTFTWHAAWATAARRDDIRRWIEVVREAVDDSGSDAETLFGPAREAAESFAQDLPPEQRAADEIDAGTWASLPRTLLVLAGWFLLVLGVVLLTRESWNVDLTLRTTAVFVALMLASGGLSTAGRAWIAGRPTATGAWALSSLALVTVTIYGAMEVADRDRSFGTLPTIVLPALGVVLIVVWWKLPERAAPMVDDSARGWPEERWFRRLEWLLRGRHKMPRTTARRLVAETRAYAQESGEHPFEPFGAPQVHALALAEADLRTTLYRSRSEGRWHLLFAVFATMVVVSDVATGSVDWATWVTGIAALASVAVTWSIRRRPAA